MNNDRYARNGTRNAGQQELLSYLGKLGLEQGTWLNVFGIWTITCRMT